MFHFLQADPAFPAVKRHEEALNGPGAPVSFPGMARRRSIRPMIMLLALVGTVPLLGSECEQPLFPVIDCETDADCVTPCTDECVAIDEELLSAECDANMFCDCMCMPPE